MADLSNVQVTTSSQVLEMAFRANSNVTTFTEQNSDGNMQSQEAQTSISAFTGLKTVMFLVLYIIY